MKRIIGNVIIASLLVLLAGCFQSTISIEGPEPEPEIETGSLSINLPSIAPWLRSINPDTTAARAYLYATSVKVVVLSGSTIVWQKTQSLSLTNTDGSSTSLQNLTGIPAGTGYTVWVYIYNSVVSSSNSVVRGSKEGIDILNGETTNAEIVCLPSSSSALTANITYSVTLAEYGEKWYQLSALAGIPYTFEVPGSSSLKAFIFDADGEFIADASSQIHAVTPPADTTYYIGLAAGDTAVSSVSYRVTAEFPPVNEGTLAEPIALSLDTDHLFAVGTSANGDEYSYYSFTSGSAGDYFFSVDSTSLNYTIAVSQTTSFTSSDATVYASNKSTSVALPSLSGSTLYYICLRNLYSTTNMSVNGRIVSPEEISANSRNEGSAGSPISLDLGTERSCLVGSEDFDSSSYYSFVAGTLLKHEVVLGTISGGYAKVYVYSSSFSGYTVAFDSSMVSNETLTINGLVAGSTYYLKLIWVSDGSTDQPIVPLAVNNTDPQFASLSVSDTYTAGTFSSTVKEVWYSVSVEPSTLYAIGWDDSYSGSGTYTCDVAVYAYDSNNVPIFSGKDSSYSTETSYTTKSDESVIYIMVKPYNSGNTGTFGVRVHEPPTGNLNLSIR